MLFCETHDLVWEIISVSEKRMKNCIVKIIDNVFEKNDEVGYFLQVNRIYEATCNETSQDYASYVKE